MPLTDIEVRKTKPREKVYRLSDGEGMYLEVTPAGAKYWRLKYRLNGKEKRLALGVYPRVKLKEARERREAARKLVGEGKDPVQAQREAKRAAKAAAENSFESVAKEWISKQGKWSDAHADRVLKSLENNVFPAIGRRPITEIKPGELLEVLRAVERRGALDVASRLLQRSAAVFRFAIQTGKLDGNNPATELRGSLKTRKVVHRAALPASELPDFLAKLDAYAGLIQTRLALHLLLLTFVRPGELRGAQWDEFNLAGREWRIPAARMKMHLPHIVPLSSQTISVLKQLHSLSGHRLLLFPGERDRTKPMSENTLVYALYRMGYHSRATAHGFRGLASTVLNEIGHFRPDAIERQLAHIEGNKVRKAYNHAEYLPERRRMMKWWGAYVANAASDQ